jgi:hypothetical protein
MIQELHTQLAAAQGRLDAAEAAGLDHEVDVHRARIDDLIDIAVQYGIDLKPWPEQSPFMFPTAEPGTPT